MPERRPEVDWVTQMVGRWLEAWNSHQVDRVLQLLTDDVEAKA